MCDADCHVAKVSYQFNHQCNILHGETISTRFNIQIIVLLYRDRQIQTKKDVGTFCLRQVEYLAGLRGGPDSFNKTRFKQIDLSSHEHGSMLPVAKTESSSQTDETLRQTVQVDEILLEVVRVDSAAATKKLTLTNP